MHFVADGLSSMHQRPTLVEGEHAEIDPEALIQAHQYAPFFVCVCLGNLVLSQHGLYTIYGAFQLILCICICMLVGGHCHIFELFGEETRYWKEPHLLFMC